MQTALRLAAAGLVVLPCHPETKRALCKFNAATNLPRGIIYFWDRHPTAMPAIHLTACGLVAIDLDRGHDSGADGIAAFDTLLDQYGEIPPCPTVRTPRGGVHLYFRQSAGRELGVRNSASQIGPGIDVRGYHGYVIAPGAILATGEFYETIAGTPDLAESFVAGTIPEIPSWLVELAERRPDLPTRVPSAAEPAADARCREWALSALDGEASGLAATEPGGRNHKLNAVVYRLAKMAARGWLTQSEIWSAVESACIQNGYLTSKDSSDGPARFRATYNSAFRAGLAKPASDPPERAAPAKLITLVR
jgi:bifunctional DNA primase/polymerase-like protein